MSSRPRRSAAQRASVAITDMADRDNMSSSRSRRSGEGNGKGLASVSRGGQDDKDHTYLTVKLPANKLRQATGNRQGSSISVSSDSAPKRPTRGNKKTYVVDDSDSDEEGEDEIQVGAPAGAADEEDEDMDDADADADADADGEALEDEMDVDAEGEDDEDAEGEEDVDMTPAQPAPVIKIAKPVKTSPSTKKTKQVTPKKAAGQSTAANADDSDDDELSDLDSDDEAMNVGDEDAEGEEEDEEDDMDADGEEVEEDQDAEGEPDADVTTATGPKPGEIDSDDDGSRGETPDLSKMTQRQRARFEGLDESHYQALSNEVQAKKVFTVEEKAMRRAEMARRRRNLSEKRNEEVKQETINKLLKKQASKTNRKSLAAIGEEGKDADEEAKPSPVFIRWTNNREGSYIAVPDEMMEGPAGRLFTKANRPAPGTGFGGPRKMVEEVS